MGDVGSLALAPPGTVAILIKQELLLVIVGGVFVLEALSVVIQVASFQLTGKRVFAWRRSTTIRAERMERAEGHLAIRDSRSSLRCSA